MTGTSILYYIPNMGSCGGVPSSLENEISKYLLTVRTLYLVLEETETNNVWNDGFPTYLKRDLSHVLGWEDAYSWAGLSEGTLAAAQRTETSPSTGFRPADTGSMFGE